MFSLFGESRFRWSKFSTKNVFIILNSFKVRQTDKGLFCILCGLINLRSILLTEETATQNTPAVALQETLVHFSFKKSEEKQKVTDLQAVTQTRLL